MLAMTPARPGILAVAKPLVSTETTVLSEDVQVKLPTEPVMSWPLWEAFGVNWWVWPTERHEPAGSVSVLTEVIEG
jgi:hypothetical protein